MAGECQPFRGFARRALPSVDIRVTRRRCAWSVRDRALGLTQARRKCSVFCLRCDVYHLCEIPKRVGRQLDVSAGEPLIFGM